MKEIYKSMQFYGYLFVIMIVLSGQSYADDTNTGHVKQTFAVFVFLEVDNEKGMMRIVHEHNAFVNSNDEFCCLEDKDFDLVDDGNVSDKSCKIECYEGYEKYNPVKVTERFYPFDSQLKPVKITDEIYDTVGVILDRYGEFTHDKEKYNIVHTIHEHEIELLIDGTPMSSRGMCSLQSSANISIKIDEIILFENTLLNSYCSTGLWINEIVIDLKNEEIRLLVNPNGNVVDERDSLLTDESSKEGDMTIPFTYFKEKKIKRLFTKNIFYELIANYPSTFKFVNETSTLPAR